MRGENSIDGVVIALCFDYPRRQSAIMAHTATHRTETEFKYLNFKIFDAAAEIAGERHAEVYIKEIGARTGYAKSKMYFVSEVTYKNYKRLIKDNIAKKLHLVD